MTSTRTVKELVQHFYGAAFAQAFDKVDLEVASVEATSTSVDVISTEYLGSALQQAILGVELEQETFEVHFETPQRRIDLIARGHWLFVVAALIAMTVVTFVLGIDVAVTLLRTIFSA